MPKESIYNEKELLQQVAEGSETAFRTLFDKYCQKIYVLAMYLTHSDVLSEEIVQDVFMKVWNNREQLLEIDYFNSWVRTIARNTVLNYLRSLAREKLALNKLELNENANTSSSEDILIEKQYRQILEEAIRQLPPQQKKVYLLSRQSGLKNEDIARQLGISIHTTKEHLQRALYFIRSYLDDRIELVVIAAISYYLP